MTRVKLERLTIESFVTSDSLDSKKQRVINGGEFRRTVQMETMDSVCLPQASCAEVCTSEGL